MEVEIKLGSLAGDLDGLSRAIGIPPQSAIYLNEYCIDGHRFPDLAEPSSWVRADVWSSLYPLSLAGKTSTLLTLAVPDVIDSYLEDIGFIPEEARIFQACQGRDISRRFYPEGSIVGRLLNDPETASPILKGKTIVASFVTEDLVDLAGAHDAHLLIRPEECIKFNSKSYMRETAENLGLALAPGVIISPDQSVETGLEAFLKSLDHAEKGLWLKLATAGGGGTKRLAENRIEAINEVLMPFLRDAASAVLSDHDLQAFDGRYEDLAMPFKRDLVLEQDLSLQNDLEVIGNFGFQAIIGHNAITYVGAAKQIIEDGVYAGGESIASDEDKTLEQACLPDIFKVFRAYQLDGYRGFMGVDALIADQSGSITPYILEANCRVTGATPLIAAAHKLSRQQNGQDVFARLCTVSIPVHGGIGASESEHIFSSLEDDLYKQDMTSGIVPLMMDVFPDRSNMEVARLRCVIFAKTHTELQTLNARLIERFPAQ